MKRIEFELYYSKFSNFGDLLNEYIPEKLFPIQVKQRFFQDADMMGIGSILDRLLDHGILSEYDKKRQPLARQDRPIHIWGPGLMYCYDPAEQKLIRPVRIHALRGELTRKTISAILGREVSCVLGDPGILASYVLPPEDKKYDLGIIPHFIDADNPVFEELHRQFPSSIIIDATQSPETVLKQISSCRRTISTSLHGLIISDAYNIPNCWCEVSDKVMGSGYKFHDYFSSFGSDREPFDLRSGQLPDPEKDFVTSFRDYSEVHRQQRALLRCFPRSLLVKAFLKKIRSKLKRILKRIRKRF